MAQSPQLPRPLGKTYAVCNTGPLISAFQSNSYFLFTRIFAEIHISMACVAELKKHGWDELVQAAEKLVVVELKADEQNHALEIAEQIAEHPDTNDPAVENHLGEAQAIVLALRPEHENDLLLLDELAARAIAKKLGIKFSGFPGVLLLATQGGMISANDLKRRLEDCRKQGTHYSAAFIQQVYLMAQTGRKVK